MQDHVTLGRLFSASDLVAFVGCRHRTTLDAMRLSGLVGEPVEPDVATQLVQAYGNRHERAHLDELKASGHRVIEIDKNQPLEEQVRLTRQAMQAGADIIFQAALLQPPFLGYADFLLRVPGRSSFGDFSYEVADTKLAKTNKPKFLIQLCLYADLLAAEQGALPEHLHVVLGTLTDADRERRGLQPGQPNVARLRTGDYIEYVQTLRSAFLAFVHAREQTQPLPTATCGACGWREHCQAEWERQDHVCRVANIRRTQIDKLAAAGLGTLSQLAESATPVTGIGTQVLDKLRRQADLQRQPNDANGQLRIQYLPPAEDGKPRGLELLPQPDPGDLYFDMEGFPHETGGLEYLFGIGWAEGGDPSRFRFKAFWAHDHQQERVAFEHVMDFVEQHLQRHPNAHIYHYAAYENTAIKRLSGVHGTRAELRDRLLREQRLVDLYRVVSSGLLLAVPGYSIKKVEAYYRGERQGTVANAGESIVQYEAFRAATDVAVKQDLLRGIEAYNKDDVESTWQLHRWLERVRPPATPRRQRAAPTADAPPPATEREQRELAAREALGAWVDSQPKGGRAEATRLAELLGQLLGFYWRCKLPTFWRIFARLEADPEELTDDPDCLAMLVFTGDAVPVKQSTRYTYRVPAQETKLYTGASVSCLTDALPASNFVYDEEQGLVSFTRKREMPAPPPLITVCFQDNVDTDPKLEAIFAYAHGLRTGKPANGAVASVLLRKLPSIEGLRRGDTVAPSADVDAVHGAITRLNASHLAIQGPPGTGKTTLASKVIARLLRDGNRVAITSNSHAAINHLLKAAAAQAKALGTSVTTAVVKADADLPAAIKVVESDRIDSDRHRLVGGTAWLFCRAQQRRRWDYLFVDEASQVSLADVIAAGSCARNIVLLGDQMQLPQPTQGVHPGESGLSALDFLMHGRATVPAHEGIFLGETYRMHPDVCRPISDTVYDGRLRSAAGRDAQRLELDANADPALRPTGVAWVRVDHQDCSQVCDQEVGRVLQLYKSLLSQRWTDKQGRTHRIGPQDILVLAPYNQQVRALAKALGPDARVGTVDKFQGQEAAVAICSMTSSDPESMPRGPEFLFSMNRLNVAVSRAKCLALIVATAALKTTPCSTVEAVKLINFFNVLTRTAHCRNSHTTHPSWRALSNRSADQYHCN